jgi:exonuclease VII large subunit
MTRADLRDQLGNIDQIREILFGSQIRQYGDRVEQVEASLADLEQEMRDRTEGLKQSLSAQIQSAVEGLEQALKSIKLQDAKDKADTRQQLDYVNKRLSSNVETLDRVIDKQADTLRSEFSSSQQKLRDELKALREQFLTELESRSSTLTNDKVAREEIAEMLFELGLKLKGNQSLPGLEESKEYLLPGNSD